MAAHIGQGFAKNAGNLAADRRRKIDLRHVTNKLRSNASVLPVTGDHASEKIDEMARIKVERFKLLDQMTHVGGLVLHQLLDVEQLLFAFGGGNWGTRAQRRARERNRVQSW